MVVQVTGFGAMKLSGGSGPENSNAVVAGLIDSIDETEYNSDTAFASIMILQITATRITKFPLRWNDGSFPSYTRNNWL